MIYNFLSDYLSIIIFLFIALFLSIGFILANFLAAPNNPDPEKLLLIDSLIKSYKSCLINTYPNTYCLGILILTVKAYITLLTNIV